MCICRQRRTSEHPVQACTWYRTQTPSDQEYTPSGDTAFSCRQPGPSPCQICTSGHRYVIACGCDGRSRMWQSMCSKHSIDRQSCRVRTASSGCMMCCRPTWSTRRHCTWRVPADGAVLSSIRRTSHHKGPTSPTSVRGCSRSGTSASCSSSGHP